MSLALEIRGVLFSDLEGKDRLAQPLSVSLERGERLAVVASETSAAPKLLEVMSGLRSLHQGECFMLENSVRSGRATIRDKISYATNFDPFEDSLSVIENLSAYGELFGVPARQAWMRGLKILRRLKLDEIESRPVHMLSPLFRRLVGIAAALIPEPEILLLDRLSLGLRGEESKALWATLKDGLPKSVTVVGWELGVGDCDEFFSRLMVIQNGRVIIQGNPQQIVAEKVGAAVMDCHLEPGQLEYFLSRIGDNFRYQASPQKFVVYIRDTAETEQVLKLVQTKFYEIRPARLSDIDIQVLGGGV